MTEIDYRKEYYLKGGKKGCLLVHGITGTPAELRELGEKLHEDGFTVLGVRLKGHGTKVEDLLECSFTDWIDSAVDGFKRLKNECEEVYVIGHSMGSLLSLYIEENLKADKLIALSPPLINKNKMSSLAFLLKFFVKFNNWKQRPYTQEQKKFMLGYSSIPVVSVHEFNKLRSKVRCRLDQVTCPVLIVHSHGDETVEDRSVDVLYDNISSTIKQKVFLENSGHLIAVEGEKDKVINAVLQFIKS